MRNRTIYGLGFLVLLAVTGSTSGRSVSGRVDAKTEVAVLAADDAWGEAEISGDAAFVDDLLLPDYRSVSGDGKTLDKAAIVAGARRQTGSPEARAKVAAWKSAHPSRGEVKLFGDTAILTWVSTAPDSTGLIHSCDIFVYRAGRWRAIYSQHIPL